MSVSMLPQGASVPSSPCVNWVSTDDKILFCLCLWQLHMCHLQAPWPSPPPLSLFTVLSHHVQIQDQVWVLSLYVPSLCSEVFSLGLKRSSKLTRRAGDRAQVVDACLTCI